MDGNIMLHNFKQAEGKDACLECGFGIEAHQGPWQNRPQLTMTSLQRMENKLDSLAEAQGRLLARLDDLSGLLDARLKGTADGVGAAIGDMRAAMNKEITDMAQWTVTVDEKLARLAAKQPKRSSKKSLKSR